MFPLQENPLKLTAKTVAALKLGGKRDVIHFDDQLSGFGYRLRLGAGGKVLRSWVVQYRRGGTSRRLLLGSAAALSAEQARTMAKKALGLIAHGADPQADRADRRGKDKHTLRMVIDEYLAVKQVRPRTLVEFKRYLTVYCRPLHAMPVDAITRKDIATRLVAVGREHGSISAARTRAALSAFFTWSMQMGFVEANPVIGTLKPPDAAPRERVLSDAELAAIWRACGDDDFGRIVRLLICIPARRSEIGAMAFREFDNPENPSTFTIPAARSKNGRAHTLPLMPMALDIIKAVPKMVSRDFLFGVRATGFTRWADAKAALDRRLGDAVRPFKLHDLRRSIATRMADLGVPPHVIEQILNHVSGHKSGVAGIYNRSSYEREVRAALALWHDHVRALIEGGDRKVLHLSAAAGTG
jgi:integrase